MSRPLPRRKSAAVVPRREQKSSSRAPSTNAEFLTQPIRDELDDSEEFPDSVVPVTPDRSSGGRHIMKSQNVQAISSTSVSPSQHSVQQPKQTENHQRRQSAIPQAGSPDNQSFQSKIKARQVAEDYLQALDDTPPPELLAALRDLLEFWTKTKGLPPQVFYKGVVNSYFPHLSQSTQPRQSTTGLIQAGATEQHPDPENHGSAPAPNNIRGSQHGSKSPQVAPGGEDPAEQVAALPANQKGKSTTTNPLLRDLKSLTITNEQEFHEAFGKYGLRDITLGSVGGPVIKLVDLARETVENVKPKFQQRRRELGEAWQVLFTIIANMFVFGPTRLYHTLKDLRALSKESSADSNEHPRRNRRGPNDAEEGPMSEDGLEELTEIVRWWWARDDKSQMQRKKVYEKVYANYKKLEGVRKYDAMMSSFQENEEAIQNWALDRVGEHLDGAHYILSYIWQRITAPRGEFTFRLLPKDSKDIKKLSDLILGFRPICSLVDTFGKGVLLLLVDKAEKYIPGKVEEGQKHYPQHERIRDVALSICEVDRIKYDGRLRQLFSDLDEKALRPIVQLCEGGDMGSWLYNCPTKDHFFVELSVGERISQLLTCISARVSTEPGSDIIITRVSRARTGRSKRSMPHNSMDEAVDGEPGTSKRHRTEFREDAESPHDGPGNNTDLEEDLYNS